MQQLQGSFCPAPLLLSLALDFRTLFMKLCCLLPYPLFKKEIERKKVNLVSNFTFT